MLFRKNLSLNIFKVPISRNRYGYTDNNRGRYIKYTLKTREEL